MSFWKATKFIDENGLPYGNKQVNGKMRVSAMPYTYDIAEGNITGHTAWTKIGYNPAVKTTEEDVWSAGDVYAFPATAQQMEVYSDNNVEDIGTILHTGVTTTGGSATTLIKTGENFLTTTIAGDYIIVDKAGTVPEWGIITSVDSDTQISFTGGLSSGGSGASRATYDIIDASVMKGALAVKIDYLTSTFAEKTEIVILNGTTPVDTVNTDLYRINSFRVIAVGTEVTALNAPAGNLSLRNTAGTTTYSYITLGFTRARNAMYTVPLGKTLYVSQISVGASTPNANNVQSCRIFTKLNIEPATKFKGTGTIFYTYTELLLSNGFAEFEYTIPTKIPAGTDLKVSAVGLTGFSGPVTTVMRGWLE